MAWPRSNWQTGEALAASDLNEHASAHATWGGAVNANSQDLSALGDLSFATGKGIAQDSWSVLSLANSWVAYGSGYTAPQVRRDKQGNVFVFGSAKSGTYADGTTVCTLPAGCRPSANVAVAIAAPMVGGAVNVPQMVVASDGSCKVYNLSGAGYLHLSFAFPGA